MAKAETNGTGIGFEDTLWAVADKLRGYLLPKLLSGEARVAANTGCSLLRSVSASREGGAA